MAARADSMAGPEIVDLRRLSAWELGPLLLEETAEWARELDWDFSRPADLVRKYADMRALGGAALLDHGEVAGYGYTVIEDGGPLRGKGLIGDLYVRPAWRTPEEEARLFRFLLDGLLNAQVKRMESQLMLMSAASARLLQRERFVRLFERVLMRADDFQGVPARPDQRVNRFHLERWSEEHFDLASNVIHLSYRDHVDSEINDQYRSFQSARRFLQNIVRFPGCGDFFRGASWIAMDPGNGCPAGIVLASFVSREVAHVTQLCVTQQAQNAGLGTELLRRSMEDLRAAGARRVSLTVTLRNAGAMALYERFGFRDVRRFYALVWEGL